MNAGGARFDDGAGGDNEVQRTMLEIVNQLDGFDARGNVKVATQIVSSSMNAARALVASKTARLRLTCAAKRSTQQLAVF